MGRWSDATHAPATFTHLHAAHQASNDDIGAPVLTLTGHHLKNLSLRRGAESTRSQ